MVIIGIAGGSGSGKTTVVKKIRQAIHGNVVVIPQDSYYKDCGNLSEEEKRVMNFDHPDAIDFDLLISQLRDLKAGKPIAQPIYSYITCSRSKDETIFVEPADVVVVEGILIFCCKELLDEFDIKVFVDADDDDRLMRIIQRDIKERGKDLDWVIERYTKTVKPMYHVFIEPSKREADIIVPLGGNNHVAINVLKATIEKALKEKNWPKL